MSVRIQQILQEEANLRAVADPLGGSYYLESLTATLENRAWAFLEQIQAEGGFLRALDSGWLQGICATNQYAEVVDQDSGDRPVVGVTDHLDDITPWEIDGFQGPTDVWERSLERLKEVRSTRHSRRAVDALRHLEDVCRSTDNVMPAMLEALDAEVTVGEIGDVYREVFGDWDTPAVI
jgi:methylmalonyl-CoA mutase N-terminal domain/subunit